MQFSYFYRKPIDPQIQSKNVSPRARKKPYFAEYAEKKETQLTSSSFFSESPSLLASFVSISWVFSLSPSFNFSLSPSFNFSLSPSFDFSLSPSFDFSLSPSFDFSLSPSFDFSLSPSFNLSFLSSTSSFFFLFFLQIWGTWAGLNSRENLRTWGKDKWKYV